MKLTDFRNYANDGSMTAGADGTTIDGMGNERIERIILSLKERSYQPKPARREYIAKKNSSKKRPLGIQSGEDKLVQEVVKMILESIYEPVFSNKSHGFRPNRSCQTALKQIQNTFTGANWFVEGDIHACFDSFDHHVVIDLLRKRIDDEAFIQLIWKFLKAGYMYVHRTYNGKRVPQYTCGQYGKYPIGSLCPTQHRIKAEAVLTLIADMLRAIAEYSRNDRAEFIRTVQETQAAQQTADISKKRKRLAAAQKRAGELERLICKIYEDNALGKLPDARYEALDAQYAKEQDALNTEIAELEKAVTGYEQSRKSAEKFIALIDKYENFDTLTNTMLNEFVEKILIHERARKGSQDTTQEVEIYFNFVGRYIPPALQPVPLTPEEQEELRKKERKDRLHQNYLRRKANGKQKEWEERYNAKRKAKMEAAKAAIRAEDMEKGIFTTVSQLPRQEPHRATVSASAAV